jgi:parvulin-like peptidyl-prolyl isomerase
MTRSSAVLAALASAVVLVVSACGGESGVPAGAVAVVDGTEISKSELDRLMERTKKGFEAQKQEFPKAGTPEFQRLQQQTLAFLVQREQLERAGDELDVEVTDEDVDEALEEFVKTRFAGDRKEYEKALADQGFTEEDLRETLATTVLSTKVFEAVTKDAEVTEEEIVAYYAQNQSQYSTPASRDVRHILIAEKKPNGEVDYAKSKTEADRIHAQLEGGADFAALVRQHSADEASKAEGGKLTISKGQTVPEFDATSFELDRGELSEPVRTQFGYHVIEALSPVRKAETTPLAKARSAIRATLLQERKSEVVQEWLDDLRADSDVSYAVGFAPPELPELPTDTAPETE